MISDLYFGNIKSVGIQYSTKIISEMWLFDCYNLQWQWILSYRVLLLFYRKIYHRSHSLDKENVSMVYLKIW